MHDSDKDKKDGISFQEAHTYPHFNIRIHSTIKPNCLFSSIRKALIDQLMRLNERPK